MQLSDKQEEAANKIREWYKSGNKEYYLAGYAGTGKSTIVNEVIARLKNDGKLNVVYCAFTGKAASVLASKGNTPAVTIHSLIYKPMMIPNGKGGKKLEFVRLDDFEGPSGDSLIWETDLIVLDECSMVNEKLANDLRAFNKPILVLGDPGQLPPVFGTGAFTERAPDYFLEEIHRQAADSAIIRIATMARNKQSIKKGDYGDVTVISRREITDYFHEDFDNIQFICGSHTQRFALTKKFRLWRGFDPDALYPFKNEPVMCMKNNFKAGLYNGLMDITTEDSVQNAGAPTITINIRKGQYDSTLNHFINTARCTKPEKERTFLEIDEFDYAYAITCHKAQGSQWENVAVLDESYCFKGMSEKWLYTAITRAADRLVLLK
jgi:exodeoxyribonuclease-5